MDDEAFMVIRGDDNGQNFIVRDGMTKADAWELYRRLLRGHKQWYMVLPYTTAVKSELVARYDLRV